MNGVFRFLFLLVIFPGVCLAEAKPDVLAKYPEVAARMARACRERAFFCLSAGRHPEKAAAE